MIQKFKKYMFYLFIFVVIIFISGCTNKIVDTAPKVVTPENKSIPITGKWKIERCLDDDKENSINNSQDKLVGQYAQFAKDLVMVGDFLGKDPSYKIRKVKADEYFTYKVRISEKSLGINTQNIYVITVTSGDKYLYEFAQISKDKLVASLKDNIYLLSKESDTIDNTLYKSVFNQDDSKEINNKSQIFHSGLLLGLKNLDSAGEYHYKTLWISSINKSIQPILKTNNIFLPRKSGFSKIISSSLNTALTQENIIVVDGTGIVNKNKNNKFSVNSERWGMKNGRITKNILYVGNDYISIEVNGNGSMRNAPLQNWHVSRFMLKPLDNISSPNGVKISDFYGISGLKSVLDARNNMIKTLGQDKIETLNDDIVEENYGIFRKNGHWAFMGRLNYEQNGEYANNDFSINLIPSSKLVTFDNLYVPWTTIKDKVPDAVDAFTSPNKDIAVILTSDKLYIYGIQNGKLSVKPLQKITIDHGDTPVMAEWATGNYVESWRKTFIKNQVSEIKN